MANLGINNNKLNLLGRHRWYHGQHIFTAAETTCTISLPFKTQVESVQLTWMGTVAAGDGQLSWSVVGNVLTIMRLAGTTAGASFSFLVIGY